MIVRDARPTEAPCLIARRPDCPAQHLRADFPRLWPPAEIIHAILYFPVLLKCYGLLGLIYCINYKFVGLCIPFIPSEQTHFQERHKCLQK